MKITNLIKIGIIILISSGLVSGLNFYTIYNPWTSKLDYYALYNASDNFTAYLINVTTGTIINLIVNRLNVTNIAYLNNVSGAIKEIRTGEGLNVTLITYNGTINVNTSYIQRRISEICPTNTSIVAILQNGSITCLPFMVNYTETDPLWVANATNYYNKTYVYNKTESDSLMSGNLSSYYTKTELYNQTQTAGLISGNMSLVYTKTQSDTLMSGNISTVLLRTDATTYYVNRSSWISIDNYPAACGASNYVTQIGDTLTCSIPPGVSNAHTHDAANITSGALIDARIGNATTWHAKASVGNCPAGTIQNISSSGVTCVTPIFIELDSQWTANASSYHKAADCAAGKVVQNTTATGVQCVTPTAIEVDPLWVANATFYYNKTYVYNKTESDALLSGNMSLVYTKTQSDTLMTGNLSSYYAKTELYNQTQTASLIAGNATLVNTNIVNNMSTVYTKTQSDSLLSGNMSLVYSKTQSDTLMSGNMSLIYTKTQSDTLMSGNMSLVYKYTDAMPWVNLTSYPPACSAGQYVNTIGDTLTCAVPSGTSNAHTHDTANITSGTLPDVRIANATNWLLRTDATTYYVNRTDWTSIDSYPSACPANQYVTQIGDILTCSIVSATANETDPFWTANATLYYTKTQSDTLMSGNMSLVYTKTQSDTLMAGNLSSYYTKTELYNQTQTASLISGNMSLVYTKTQSDTLMSGNLSSYYTKTEVYNQTQTASLISGNISLVYTKTQSDSLMAGNLSSYYTKTELYNQTQTASLISGNMSNVYTKTQSDTLMSGNVTLVNTNIVNNMSTVYTKTQSDSLMAGNLSSYYAKTELYNRTQTEALLSGNMSLVYTKTQSDTLMAGNLSSYYTKTELYNQTQTASLISGNATLINTNIVNNASKAYKYSDTLPAANITTGTFGAGNYVFPNNITSGTHWLNSTLKIGICWNGTHTIVGNLTGLTCY